jgi:hypothetical protein
VIVNSNVTFNGTQMSSPDAFFQVAFNTGAGFQPAQPWNCALCPRRRLYRAGTFSYQNGKWDRTERTFYGLLRT